MIKSTRLAALAASIVLTFTLVSLIANYAKPGEDSMRLALRQAAPQTTADAPIVSSVDTETLAAPTIVR